MRVRWAVLAGLFVVVPIVEIWCLIQIGQVIGPWWTILLLVADGVLGSLLVKREGRRAWRALTRAIEQHKLPHQELADGALVLVGGTLLLTPGFVTDVVGLVCILPFTRPIARRVLTGAIARRVHVLNLPSHGGPQRPSGPDVVPGEVVD